MTELEHHLLAALEKLSSQYSQDMRQLKQQLLILTNVVNSLTAHVDQLQNSRLNGKS